MGVLIGYATLPLDGARGVVFLLLKDKKFC